MNGQTAPQKMWEVDRLGAFFDIIHQDPVLSQTKLIAEPWDLGPNGYQDGNNNAYFQDATLSWLNWDLSEEQCELFEFVRRLLRLRKENPVFRRRDFFQGRPIHGLDVKDLYWLNPNGTEMADSDCDAGYAQCLGMGLMGGQIDETDERGQRIVGDSFLILFNAGHESVSFHLGGRAQGLSWELVLDTSSPHTESRLLDRLDTYRLQGGSLAVLRPRISGKRKNLINGVKSDT